MELFSGVSVLDEIQRAENFTEADAARYVKNVLNAMAACHGAGIIHKDLKPENILIDSEKGFQLKIIDFGTAKSQFEELEMTIDQVFGTPYYSAPEGLLGEFCDKSDIWSLGSVLYVMLSGKPPFKGVNDNRVMSAISNAEYEFDLTEWQDKTEESKDFINMLLQKEPAKRPSASEALSHPWLLKMQGPDANAVPNLTESVARLSEFRAETRLRQASRTYMINYTQTKKLEQDLAVSFKNWDKDGNGMISKLEFIEGYRELHEGVNQDVATALAIEIFDSSEQDGNGHISYQEWCA